MIQTALKTVMRIERLFNKKHASILGMVHLDALAGTPKAGRSLQQIVGAYSFFFNITISRYVRNDLGAPIKKPWVHGERLIKVLAQVMAATAHKRAGGS